MSCGINCAYRPHAQHPQPSQIRTTHESEHVHERSEGANDEAVPSSVTFVKQGVDCVASQTRYGDVGHIAESQFVVLLRFLLVLIKNMFI